MLHPASACSEDTLRWLSAGVLEICRVRGGGSEEQGANAVSRDPLLPASPPTDPPSSLAAASTSTGPLSGLLPLLQQQLLTRIMGSLSGGCSSSCRCSRQPGQHPDFTLVGSSCSGGVGGLTVSTQNRADTGRLWLQQRVQQGCRGAGLWTSCRDSHGGLCPGGGLGTAVQGIWRAAGEEVW